MKANRWELCRVHATGDPQSSRELSRRTLDLSLESKEAGNWGPQSLAPSFAGRMRATPGCCAQYPDPEELRSGRGSLLIPHSSPDVPPPSYPPPLALTWAANSAFCSTHLRVSLMPEDFWSWIGCHSLPCHSSLSHLMSLWGVLAPWNPPLFSCHLAFSPTPLSSTPSHTPAPKSSTSSSSSPRGRRSGLSSASVSLGATWGLPCLQLLHLGVTEAGAAHLTCLPEHPHHHPALGGHNTHLLCPLQTASPPAAPHCAPFWLTGPACRMQPAKPRCSALPSIPASPLCPVVPMGINAPVPQKHK